MSCRHRLADAAAVAINVTDRRFMPYYAELPHDRHQQLDSIPEDVDTVADSLAEMIVTAANGVRWRRLPGSTSSAEELLAVLAGLGGDRIAREWSLWREGEPRREDDHWHEVLFQ
jgi:hypothetical protein